MDRKEKHIPTDTEIEVEGAFVNDIETRADQTSTFQTTSSDNPFFIRTLTYTKAEEAKIIRILDTRLFTWILLTTFVLNMDRTNNSNAVSDNLPQDLGFTIDTVNLATAIYSILFSIFCFSGAIMAKIVGPARCKSASVILDRVIDHNRDSDSDVLLGTRYNGSCVDN